MNQIAYGFFNLQNVMDRRVTEVGVSIVDDAINATVAEHQRQIAALSGLFVRRTTGFKTKFRTASVARLQPLDENGRALPIRPAGQYEIAFPIQRGGIAWGTNYEARIKMTVQEANEATNTMTMADARWMRDHILAGVYTNVPWTFNDDEHGALTIQGLANGDAVVYNVFAGADNGATAQHYVAQAAAISDAANPFPAMHDTMVLHPENQGRIIALVPTNLKASIMALSTFYPADDVNLALGSGETRFVGRFDVPVPGEFFGYESGGVFLVEWRSLPDSYIVAVAERGERPLSMREDTAPELQGFNRVADRDNHPWYERQYLRKAGFGAWNRVGAYVLRIGNASYAIPTGYTSPMA